MSGNDARPTYGTRSFRLPLSSAGATSDMTGLRDKPAVSVSPPISFDQTCAFVEQAQTWKLRHGGGYVVAPWGEEDDTRYRVIIGLPEVLIDHRCELASMDAPVVFVDKSTGEITLETYIEVMDEVDAMRPVGTPQPRR